MAASSPSEHIFLLVVSCTHYVSLPDLPATFEYEAAAFRSMLVDPLYGRVRTYNSHLLVDASVVDVEVAMELIAEKATPESVLIVAFFTHGLRVNRGPLQGSYVALQDTRISSEEELVATSVGARSLGAMLEACPARKHWIVFHCGHKERLLNGLPGRARHIGATLQRRLLSELQTAIGAPRVARAEQLNKQLALATTDEAKAELQGQLHDLEERQTVVMSATALHDKHDAPYFFPPSQSEFDEGGPEEGDGRTVPSSLFLRALQEGLSGAAMPSIDGSLPFITVDAVWRYLEREVPRLASEVMVKKKGGNERPLSQHPLVESCTSAPGRMPSFPVCLAPKPPEAPQAPEVTGRTTSTLRLQWRVPMPLLGFPALTGVRLDVKSHGRTSKGWVTRRTWEWHYRSVAGGAVQLPTADIIRGLVTSVDYEVRLVLRTAGGWGEPSEPCPPTRPETGVVPDRGFEHIMREPENDSGLHGVVVVLQKKEHRAVAEVQRRGLDRLAGYCMKIKTATELVRLYGLDVVVEPMERFTWDEQLQGLGLLLLVRCLGHVNLHADICEKWTERLTERLEELETRFEANMALMLLVRRTRDALAARTELVVAQRMGANAAASKLQALVLKRRPRVPPVVPTYDTVVDPASGEPFYVHKESGETVWELPEGCVASPPPLSSA